MDVCLLARAALGGGQGVLRGAIPLPLLRRFRVLFIFLRFITFDFVFDFVLLCFINIILY